MTNCLMEAACSAPLTSPVTHISDPKILIPSTLAEIKKMHNPLLTSCSTGQKDVGIHGGQQRAICSLL